MRLKLWFAYAPPSVVCPQPRSTTCVGWMPALCPTTALTMEPPSVQSPFAQPRCYRCWGIVYRLLRGHYSSAFAPTDSCANPSGSPLLQLLASFGESEQVATSPCCQRDLPDVISANPSSDAWSHTTAGLTECTYLFLPPCHRPSPTGVWVGLPASTREHDFPRSVFSRLQTFLYVQAAEFAHLPDRSYPCAYCRRAAEVFTSEQNMLRYLRMHRIC